MNVLTTTYQNGIRGAQCASAKNKAAGNFSGWRVAHSGGNVNNGDFAEEPTPLEGDKVRLDDIVNQEILITGFDTKPSRYSKNKSGKYLTLQFRSDDQSKPNVVFTGSDVLIDQLERYKDELPFLATIKKVNRYYTLS